MTNYFYVENAYDGENVLTLDSSYGMTNVQYAADPASTWTTVTFSSNTATITIPQGGKVYLRGTNQTLSNLNNYQASTIISCSQSFNVGGDLTTLLELEGNVLDLTGRDYVFNTLFSYSKVVDVSKLILPSITLSNNCYRNMFWGCRSLITAPELPATTLTEGCYVNMFNGCTSLVNAPELPATTLANYCYQYMFNGCISLTTAPELPATNLAKGCCDSMFYKCTSLQTAPELPATTLTNYCYSAMFVGCTSLVNAPKLPATTLAPGCYYEIFRGCTKLNNVTALFTDNTVEYCLYNWLGGVAQTGTFIHNPEASQEVLDSSHIPTGWTRQAYVVPEPVLPRETKMQVFRNSNVENSIEYFIGDGGIWFNYEFIKQLKDGEQILGRYKLSEGQYGTLYGIAHIITTDRSLEPNSNSYIEVFQSRVDAKKYGNGIIVEDGVVKTRLSQNGGLTYDENTEGQKGIKIKNGENVKSDANGLSIVKDDKSIIGTDTLQVGTVDCGDWTL